MIEGKYAGKLYLMGEYLVLEPGKTAVILPINRYLTVRVKNANSFSVISEFGKVEGKDVFNQDEKLPYVKAGIAIVKEYLSYKNKKMNPFQLVIESELISSDNIKFGFGSSGVVLVAVIDTLLKFHEINLPQDQLFKITVLAQKQMQELSSGGDIATAIYGQCIAYTRYDTEWLSKQHGLEIIDEDWPLLDISPLPFDLDVLVGWTQKAISTKDFVSIYLNKAQEDPEGYLGFTEEAETIIQNFLDELDARNIDAINHRVEQYRRWMLRIQDWLGIAIETKELTALIEIAKKHELSAKVSGSGGGDCGIVIHNGNPTTKKTIFEEWKKEGVLPLDVRVHQAVKLVYF